VSNWLIAGVTPQPHGNENVTSSPSGAFRTGDGLLNIAANKQEQWEILCRHLGRPDLVERPEYRSREARKAARAALKAELEEILAAKGAIEWAAELNRAGVPSGAVLAVPDILEHPQFAGRGMLAEFPAVPGAERDIRVVRTGFKLDGQAPAVAAPPPVLGADNETIYGELGIGAEELASLKAEGVL
jgi:formyl-CoA transferase